MNKIPNAKIFAIYVILMLVISAIPFTLENASATISVIDNDTGTADGTMLNRKMVRLNDTTKSLGVIYIDNDAGDVGLYFKKSIDNGLTWGAPVTIFDGYGSDVASCSVAVDSLNTIHVIMSWQQPFPLPTDWDILYTNSTDNGTTWSMNNDYGLATLLYSNSNQQDMTAITIDSMDNVHVTWMNKGNIAYIKYTKATSSWGTKVDITTGTTYTQRYPSIAVDGLNNIYIAWTGTTAGSPINYQIREKKYTNATSTWGSISEVTSTSTIYQYAVQIATDSSNILHAVWAGETTPGGTFTARHASLSGAVWSSIHNLATPSTDISYPMVSLSRDDIIHVTWDDNGAKINYSRSIDTGTTWSTPTAVITDSFARYPNMIWGRYPIINSNNSNIPLTGFALAYSHIVGMTWSVKYYSSSDLSWGSGTAGTPPTITFVGTLETNHTVTVDHINATMSSSGNPHYSFLDMDGDNVLWMRFEQFTGAGPYPVDNSTYHNNATGLYGTPVQASGCKFNYGWYGDGIGDSYTVPTSASLDALDNTSTFSFWAKCREDFTSFPAIATSGRTFIRFYYDSGNYFIFGLNKTLKKFYVGTVTGSAGGAIYVSKTFTTGFITDWHHYTVVLNLTGASLYIDGAYNYSAIWAGSQRNFGYMPKGYFFFIGRDGSSSTNKSWYGWMDEITFFTRSLEGNEILSLYNSSITDYNNNFTGLANGNYTFRGHAQDINGLRADTAPRWIVVNTAPPPPPTTTDIQFIAPTPINGTSSHNYIPVSIQTTGLSHYTFCDFNHDVLLWMTMDAIDGSGNPTDSSTYENNGTKVGNAVQSTTGAFGDSFLFDGNGDAINIPTSTSLDTIDATTTFSFWAKSNIDWGAFPQTSAGAIRLKQSSSNRIYINFCKTYTGLDKKAIALANSLGTSPSNLIVTGNLGDGFITNWHHYAVVCNSTYASGYIDGVYQGEYAFTPGTRPNLDSLNDGFTTDIGVGSDSLGTWNFNGYIDEMMIFNRELNVNEILSLYNATANQYAYNFTMLPNANYTFQGYCSDDNGTTNHTEERWSNISTSYAPTITLTYPTDGSTGVILFPTCLFYVYDGNNDTLTVTIQENSTGSWITRQTSIVPSGTNVTWQFAQANHVSTPYYWRVQANDGYWNTWGNYSFTTADYFYQLSGLPDNRLDWDGLPGSSYWSNSTGTYNETMVIEIYGGTSGVYNIGIWSGDLYMNYDQTLTEGTSNTVYLPQWVINGCPSNSIEDVFYTCYDYLIWVTNADNSTNWYRYRNSSLNTLNYITADTTYHVIVNQTSDLEVNGLISIGASNISAQFSSDNTTWGTTTKGYQDGGNEFIMNYTTWTNANGCYGTNPFIGNFTLLTKPIYCRYKLTLPLSMPQNYSYVSLASDNWKVYVYSTTIPNETLHTLYPATPPTSGHFSLKWSTLSQGTQGSLAPVAVDINGDGMMELFIAGYNSTDTSKQKLACINGTTGTVIWTRSLTLSGTEPSRPLDVYDFDKDGQYEIIWVGSIRAQMFNALTGATEWDVPVPQFSGNHMFAHLDHGTQVYLYVSGSDDSFPYDGKLSKLYANNGTVIRSVPIYYSCNGGVSIADINNDDKYEIVVTDRGQDMFPGTPAKSVQCYDEDLNLLWYGANGYPTCSSHAPALMDIDGDGDMEVIIGKITYGYGSGGVYVFNHDGTIWRHQNNTGFIMHNQFCLADIDSDGHIELISGQGPDHVVVFDLTDWTIDFRGTYETSDIPDVGNVILDPGLVDDKLEILAGRSSPRICKYNTTTSTWQESYYTFSGIVGDTSLVQDVDHDGLNELIWKGHATGFADTLYCYETKVPATTPRPRTGNSYYGERHLNNGLYYPPPFSDTPLSTELTFGGYASIPSGAGAFLINCISQRPLVELNGYYGLGNYTTFINTTVYLPDGWSVYSFYLRIKNDTGLIYENITTGFVVSTIDPTHKLYSKVYNPSHQMTGVIEEDADVYCSLIYENIITYSGNSTFPDLFSIYNIDQPYNGTSSYNTTTNAVNMTWDDGNYTDRYVVVRKTGIEYPTTPTDGTVVQNSTATSYNESSVLSSRAYSVFGYNDTTRSYTDPLNIPWGAIGTNCFNESNPSQALTFDLEVTNQQGTIVYKRTGLHNTHFIDVQDIPYGTNTIFIVESVGYRQRIYYKDITLNQFLNYSFYLPPSQTHGGNTTPPGDCTLRLSTNSINISSYTSDAIIVLSDEIEDMVSVEIYNSSLYITYGGWLMIPESKYTVTTTQVTIDKSVLDKNTTMARVTYYYMYCPGDTIDTPLYYLRVVETIETEYSTYDRGVEGAKVDIKRYINTTGQYESVAQPITDANGYVNVYLLPGTLYKVLITKTGYDDALSDYIPAPANQFGQTAEKTFRLTVSESTVTPADVDYLFKNIIWSIEPIGIRHNGAFTVWFNITSSDNKLEWYSMQILAYNDTNYTWYTIFYQNDSNPGGGSISFNVPNVTGKYAIKCYFKKTGFPAQELGETGSLIHFIQYLQNWMHGIPDYAYYIVLLFIMTVAMGFFFIYFGTGLSTGYIGLIIFAIGLFIHPVSISIGTTSVSGWLIFAITFVMYTMGIFLWSRI